jgi:polysaccharide pyruvyl transferase WcaK-like protein
LSYLPKTDGVLARLGMKSWVLPAADLDPQRLAATLSRALGQEQELRDHVRQRLPELRDGALRAIDLTMDSVNGEAAA